MIIQVAADSLVAFFDRPKDLSLCANFCHVAQ